MQELVAATSQVGACSHLATAEQRESQTRVINRAKELLADGTVARVLGWKAGDLPYNPEPAYFEKQEDFENFVYNGFCGANLSKYMIEASKLEGKTLVCLKPCDTYSLSLIHISEPTRPY